MTSTKAIPFNVLDIGSCGFYRGKNSSTLFGASNLVEHFDEIRYDAAVMVWDRCQNVLVYGGDRSRNPIACLMTDD
jgi:hypothetical protein